MFLEERKQLDRFCSPNGFNSDIAQLPVKKMLVLKLTLVPSHKWSFEAKIATLLSFRDEMRMEIPLFISIFL